MKTISTKIYFLLVLIASVSISAASNTTMMVAPPVNDLIANAIDLNYGPLPYSAANVNFPEATFTVDGTSPGCPQVVPGIWYKFYATQNGNVSAFIQTNSGAIVTFYTAFNGNVTNANQLNYVDQPSNVCGLGNFSQIDAIGGTYYYIFMRNEAISNVAINVANAFAFLDNDQITSATEVDLNNPYNPYNNIHFLMATNNTDGGQSGCDSDLIAGIWYYFYSMDAINIRVTLSSDPNVSALVIYSAVNGAATSGSDLTFVDQPGNVCGLQDEAIIDTEPNTWYYIFAATAEPYANVAVHNSVLGVSDNTLEGFSYYPNPVTSEINLSAKSNLDEVTIFNLVGQKVYTDKPNNSRKSIDISNLQTGMYIMKISSEGKTASYKIAKK